MSKSEILHYLNHPGYLVRSIAIKLIDDFNDIDYIFKVVSLANEDPHPLVQLNAHHFLNKLNVNH